MQFIEMNLHLLFNGSDVGDFRRPSSTPATGWSIGTSLRCHESRRLNGSIDAYLSGSNRMVSLVIRQVCSTENKRFCHRCPEMTHAGILAVQGSIGRMILTVIRWQLVPFIDRIN